MAKPKKPKLLKAPKKPSSKTIASMENYLKKAKEVAKQNAKKLSQYKSDLKKFETLSKKVMQGVKAK